MSPEITAVPSVQPKPHWQHGPGPASARWVWPTLGPGGGGPALTPPPSHPHPYLQDHQAASNQLRAGKMHQQGSRNPGPQQLRALGSCRVGEGLRGGWGTALETSGALGDGRVRRHPMRTRSKLSSGPRAPGATHPAQAAARCKEMRRRRTHWPSWPQGLHPTTLSTHRLAVHTALLSEDLLSTQWGQERMGRA